jgi:hypothetical protein
MSTSISANNQRHPDYRGFVMMQEASASASMRCDRRVQQVVPSVIALTADSVVQGFGSAEVLIN